MTAIAAIAIPGIMLYCLLAAAEGFSGITAPGAAKAFLVYSFLLLLLLINTQALLELSLFRVQPDTLLQQACYLSGASNHFIMTLDIISLFSMLLLILYHALKMAKPCPASQTAI